jgi:hypothetical protein
MGVDIGTAFDQLRNNILMSLHGGFHQGGPSSGVLGINGYATVEKLSYGREVALGCGREQSLPGIVTHCHGRPDSHEDQDKHKGETWHASVSHDPSAWRDVNERNGPIVLRSGIGIGFSQTEHGAAEMVKVNERQGNTVRQYPWDVAESCRFAILFLYIRGYWLKQCPTKY